MDPHSNGCYGTVKAGSTIIGSAAAGVTIILNEVGRGAQFPSQDGVTQFNVILAPASTRPQGTNFEICRVTCSSDTLTVVTGGRNVEGSTNHADVAAGWQVFAAITKKTLTDIEEVLGLSAKPVLDVGVLNQARAGRAFTLADFTTILGLTAPVGLYNLADATDLSGNGRNLSNRGAVAFGKGITGATTEAAIFTGADKALYLADTGAADPFRIPYGSFGCWFLTPKRSVQQNVLTKNSATVASWALTTDAANHAQMWLSANGTLFDITGGSGLSAGVVGFSDVCDGRWHFAVVTYDGTVAVLYVDGQVEAAVASTLGPIAGSAAPFNVGASGADGTNVALSPLFGPADAAFVTKDVLGEDQVRFLYAAKVAHGATWTPNDVTVQVRRYRKKGGFATTDFPSTPLHLYNFAGFALTDLGSLNNALTNNGAATGAAGMDGSQNNAANLVAASSQYFSVTDTGMPSGTATRTLWAWVKTTAAVAQRALSYGSAAAFNELGLAADGTPVIADQTSSAVGTKPMNDGLPHLLVAVIDNGAADGLKKKLYVDGKLVGTDTALASLTLLGANGLRIGRAADTGTSYWGGQVDAAGAIGVALTPDQVASLAAVGSLPLPASVKNAGDNVVAVDATYVYLDNSTLETQDRVDVEVGP